MISPAIDAEKAFEKTQHPFIILKKNSQETRNRRDLPQSDKGHLPKTYRLNEHSSPKFGKKSRMSTFTSSIQFLLKVLASATRQEKDRKGIQIGKRKTVFLCG